MEKKLKSKKELRNEIDKIDEEMVKLFVRRMGIAAQVAAYKKENNLPIFVPAREEEKLADVAKKAGADMADYAKQLYGAIFELSRGYQQKLNEDA